MNVDRQIHLYCKRPKCHVLQLQIIVIVVQRGPKKVVKPYARQGLRSPSLPLRCPLRIGSHSSFKASSSRCYIFGWWWTVGISSSGGGGDADVFDFEYYGNVTKFCCEKMSSGQSYKASTRVNYDSRVVDTSKLLIFRTP